MTDSLVRKTMFGQSIGKGFMPDIHCPTGAPREAIVKITRAEPGGLEAQGLWRPAALGIRPRPDLRMDAVCSAPASTAHLAGQPELSAH